MQKRRLLRWSLALWALAPCVPGLAQVVIQDVDELKGRWLVSVDAGERRPRLLVVESVAPESNDAWQVTLRHSFAENEPRPIPPGRLERTPDGMRLSYATGTGATVDATFTPSGVFQGRFMPKGGRPAPVVVSPLTEDEYAELKMELKERRRAAAATPLNVRPDSRVELIYLESGKYNCPFCRAWEKDYIATGKLRSSPEGRDLQLTRVSNGRYIPDMFLPENLRPHRAFLEGKAKNLFRATPSFIVMVDDRPVSWGVGLTGWENRVQPALQRIAAAKTHKQ